jgi:hypothetical protein
MNCPGCWWVLAVVLGSAMWSGGGFLLHAVLP